VTEERKPGVLRPMPRLYPPRPVAQYDAWLYHMQQGATGDERGAWIDSVHAIMPSTAYQPGGEGVGRWRWSNRRGLWTVDAEWRSPRMVHCGALTVSMDWSDGQPGVERRPLACWPLPDPDAEYLRLFLITVGALQVDGTP
jgi:hypothetical protein